ncbi:MAG: selenocysteine-specific translation elongation factor [Proteobacteria bacterium]|nr:selenocysteine-specific translation elongation factor [Pseudomonadota bacterium]
MREVVLGTAGHVDHGKTSLVRALTGIDTDRLKEEKERGITIELGFAFLDLPCGHRLGIIDVPGHERFVKNMVAGATGIDFVAFVVAADEGVMPQTREHFEICRLLGVERGMIIITKKDMVEPDWLQLVTEETKEFFSGSFLDGSPLLHVSSTTGEGIDQFRNELDRMVAASDFSEPTGPFRLPVDRVFTMKGFGAVVTGTSISGRIKLGEDITLYPDEITARIRGIQVHAQDVEEVEAGKRTAINIQGLDKELISRGNVLATPGSLKPSYIHDADFLYLSSNKKPLKNRTRIRAHLGTAEIMGRILLLDADEIPSGTQANIQILLEEPYPTWPGDHYVIRSYSPVITIGGGKVFNGSPAKRKRFKEENGVIFETYHNGTQEEKILLYIREAGFAGLTFNELSVKSGIFGKPLKKILDKPISAKKILIIDSDSQRMIEAGVYSQLPEKAEQAMAAFHKENPLKPGVAKDELRARIFKHLDQKVFQYLLNDLIRRKVIVPDDAVVRLAGHEISVKADVKTLRDDMERFYLDAGLTAPTIKEIFGRFDKFPQKLVKEIIEMMMRDKSLVKINEDLYYHTRMLENLKEQLLAFIKREGEIDAPRFKAMTGLSRKFSIPLLEYFDKAKITIRVGDKRILRG